MHVWLRVCMVVRLFGRVLVRVKCCVGVWPFCMCVIDCVNVSVCDVGCVCVFVCVWLFDCVCVVGCLIA